MTKHHVLSFGILAYRWHNDAPEFLLVRRKETMGFVDLIRGRYPDTDCDKESAIGMYIDEMTEKEKNIMMRYSFKELWKTVFQSGSQFRKEFALAQQKFTKNRIVDLIEASGQSSFDEPEYGIPKGRRTCFESHVECAQREFYEETGIQNYTLASTTDPLIETYVGTNGIRYKHIYYMAEVPWGESNRIGLRLKSQKEEISDIRWFSLQECMQHVRPYNTAKKRVIIDAFKRLKK